MRVTGPRDLVPVVGGIDPGQGAEHGPQSRGGQTQIVQDPDSLRFRGGFDQPGEHELLERVILDHIEAQPCPKAFTELDS